LVGFRSGNSGPVGVASKRMRPWEGEVCGWVASGRGEGRRFTEVDCVKQEIQVKLGFLPYPGTLNLRMRGAAWRALRRRLVQEKGIPIIPRRGFCRAKCFRVLINDSLEGAVLFPEVSNYPADKFEIIAANPVRQRLGLKDGDLVRVRVVPEVNRWPRLHELALVNGEE